MIEQLNNSIKYLTFFTSNKVGKTGLTVTIDVYNPSGTQIVSNGVVTEVGDGLYSYVLSSNFVSAIGEYPSVFKTADTTVDAKQISALWVIGRAGIENLTAAQDPLNISVPGSYLAGTAGYVFGNIGTGEITQGEL